MNCIHGLEKDCCALCSPRGRKYYGQGYEIVEGMYKGNPVIEILENGQPFPYDTHFTFGYRKAQLILSCMDIIEEFATNTRDNGTTTIKPHVLRSRWFGEDIDVSIEPHPEFVHSSGTTIYKPWLSLRALPSGNPHISFGVRKASALLALHNKIEAWLRRQGG